MIHVAIVKSLPSERENGVEAFAVIMFELATREARQTSREKASRPGRGLADRVKWCSRLAGRRAGFACGDPPIQLPHLCTY